MEACQQEEIVHELQHAAADERPADPRPVEHQTGEQWGNGRGEAPRHVRHAGGRGALLGRHQTHHVRLARRHVHLRKESPQEQEGDSERCVRRDAGQDEEEIGRNVRVDHGGHEADAGRELGRDQLRAGAQKARHKEYRACHLDGKREAPVEP